ncbi:hypothetical protein [Phycobium rhodophyticola]
MTEKKATPTAQNLADALISVLDVEPVEENFFRGIATPVAADEALVDRLSPKR